MKATVFCKDATLWWIIWVMFVCVLVLFLTGCKTADTRNVTLPVRTSIEGSLAASERSSGHIRKFRNNAERIDFKAGRALKILDQ